MTIIEKIAPWPTIFRFVILLWIIELINLVLGHSLTRFGILPRNISGLPGVLFAPFIHGSVGHLLMNTLPLLVLGSFVLVHGRRVFFTITPVIIVVSGLGVWLMGRSAIHVGASSLIFGCFGFLVFRGVIKRSLVPLAISILTVVVYGGLLWEIFPSTPGVSWEGHFLGFLTGIICARMYR